MKSSRTLPSLLGLLAGVLCLACAPATAPLGVAASGGAPTPNIVVVFTDDLGYGDLASYGHPTIRTPELDRMAAEGMRFTQFYSADAVCTPSRAGLLTGRLPVRSGMVGDRRRVLFPDSPGGLPQSETTLAEALRERGYATAAIGKWHLGHLPPHLPTQHGFERYFGIPYSNDMDLVSGMEARPANFEPRIEYFNVPLMRDEEIIERPADQRTITRRYTDEAVRFIEEHRDRPFFLYLAHSMPHVPLFASEGFEGRSARGVYGDVIEEIDWSVGRVLQTLRELGIESRTLVVFTSDNGPWLTFDAHGGSAGLLRDGKGTTWEGGMRVPAIAWWPGSIEPGRVTPALATTLDLFPTAVEAAGGRLPTGREMDGVSLLPLLRGQRESVREVVHYYRGSVLHAIRRGPWKAHFITQSAYVGDSPVEHDPPALYHLDHDPSERHDLSAAYPQTVAELTREAARHRATVRNVPSQLDLPAISDGSPAPR